MYDRNETHAALAELASAAVEFMTTVAAHRAPVVGLNAGRVLVGGKFRLGVTAQLGVDTGRAVGAVAEYASAFGSPVVFEESPNDEAAVMVSTVGAVAGQLVQVWDYIRRTEAHALAVRWGQVPVLREMDPATVLSTLDTDPAASTGPATESATGKAGLAVVGGGPR